jgi:hypothetical protein
VERCVWNVALGNIGAEKLFHTCREISRSSHADLQDRAEELLSQTQNNFNAVRQALSRYQEAP